MARSTPKTRRPRRVGTIVDGTEMEVLEVHDKLPLKCVGTIAMVTRDWVSAQTAVSWLVDDRSYLDFGETTLRFIVQGNVLVHQRNECIQKMDGDWILFIDSDMVFQADAIKILLETQKKFDLDIVGGLCFQRTPPFQPTMYVMAQNAEHGYTFLEQWAEDAAVEVDATGMAFCLIHKRVFARIMEKAANDALERLRPSAGDPDVDEAIAEFEESLKDPWPDLEHRLRKRANAFFRWEGEYGEDFLFCRDAKASGSKVFVDTGVKIGHSGMTIINEENFFREIAFRRPDEQEFREEQLRSVGHTAITPEMAKEKLGL